MAKRAVPPDGPYRDLDRGWQRSCPPWTMVRSLTRAACCLARPRASGTTPTRPARWPMGRPTSCSWRGNGRRRPSGSPSPRRWALGCPSGWPSRRSMRVPWSPSALLELVRELAEGGSVERVLWPTWARDLGTQVAAGGGLVQGMVQATDRDEATLRDQAAAWLERDVRTIGLLDAAVPDRLAPIRAALDEVERDELVRWARSEDRWWSHVRRAAAMAPGGPALWLGPPRIASVRDERLPEGFDWLAPERAEVSALPKAASGSSSTGSAGRRASPRAPPRPRQAWPRSVAPRRIRPGTHLRVLAPDDDGRASCSSSCAGEDDARRS